MVKRMFMLGAFPPPVHGMSQVNIQVRTALESLGIEVITFDLSARSLDQGISMRLKRAILVAYVLIRFSIEITRSSGRVLYVGVSGGFGQLYEILFVALAKFFGFSVFLHHHSFAYLQAPAKLTQALIRVAGKDARHIVLCECMAKALRRHYGKEMHVRIVSNAALIAPSVNGIARQRTSLHVLGYLGNISREKGIFIFMDIIEMLYERGVTIIGKIAGPFQDSKIEAEVLNQISTSKCLRYVGAQYGEEKVRFLDAIDVLFFPSRYKNEAEPLTVHEAMARALPILSFRRGCIQEIVPCSAGSVLDDDETTAFRAADILMDWWKNPEKVRIKSDAALNAFSKLQKLHTDHFAALCSEIISNLG